MNPSLDTLVTALDPAPVALDASQLERRDQALERILADWPATSLTAPPGLDARSGGRPAARRTRRTRRTGPARRGPARLVALAAAAAGVAGAGIALPFFDPGQAAFATWTAAPDAVAAGDLAVVDPVCRLLREDSMDGRRIPYRLAATERRGDLVGLLYRSEDPDMSATCVVRQTPGSRFVTGIRASASGSSGPAYPAAPGGLTEGGIAELGEISVTDGAVGDGVVGVTIQAGDLTVEATVSEGRYYAWWPGPALTDDAGPSGEGGPESLLTYDVQLSDGTVRHDVDPTGPPD